MSKDAVAELPPFGDEEANELNVIIETPQGHRNKFRYDPERRLFQLGGVLPAGAVFPFDFGFIPGTLGQDGDPLDVLVLMDEAAFPGCWVPARLIGAIEAEQTEEGETMRNDRLIAVAAASHNHEGVQRLADLDDHLLKEIEHFFVSYNQVKDREFRPCGRSGPAQARRLVEEGIRAQKQNSRDGSAKSK